MSGLRRFVGFAGMIVGHLGMLRRIRVLALFMGIRGGPVGFSGFLVMLGCLVMIVFGHWYSGPG
jgi:hypothetical protein